MNRIPATNDTHRMSNEIIIEDICTIVAEDPNPALLPFPTEKQNANFELGVSMAIHNWHTLTTAVDNNWGGPQSAEKRDWISGVVVDEFEHNKEIDIIYIHELLSGIMEDEFDSIVEDGSTVTVATNIINCYKQCQEGIFDNIKAVYNKWLVKQQNGQKVMVNIIDDPLNPAISDDEGEDGDDDDDAMDTEHEFAQPRKERQEPIIDDDGFTVVTSNRGKR